MSSAILTNSKTLRCAELLMCGYELVAYCLIVSRKIFFLERLSTLICNLKCLLCMPLWIACSFVEIPNVFATKFCLDLEYINKTKNNALMTFNVIGHVEYRVLNMDFAVFSLMRYLLGITEEERQQRREEILATRLRYYCLKSTFSLVHLWNHSRCMFLCKSFIMFSILQREGFQGVC
jgi:hypothetical protein